MTEQRAYDLGRFQRVVGVEGPRVTGNFTVLLGDEGKRSWVTTNQVTIWDEHRHSGRVLYSGDLTGSVEGGLADIGDYYMISKNKLDDVLDVIDEMKSALVLAVDAARAAVPLEEEKK